MSYDPSAPSYSPFVWAYGSSSQTLPTRTSGSTVTNYNTTIQVNNQKSDVGTTLGSNQLNVNTAKALLWGDIRVNMGDSTFPLFKIEFEDNYLERSAALQANSASASTEDCCFSVSEYAQIKIKIVNRIKGSTITPYSRILGMVINQ